MINLEVELDAALSRVVDLEDQIDQKDDAIRALLAHRALQLAEIGSLTKRNAELEAALASKAAG